MNQSTIKNELEEKFKEMITSRNHVFFTGGPGSMNICGVVISFSCIFSGIALLASILKPKWFSGDGNLVAGFEDPSVTLLSAVALIGIGVLAWLQQYKKNLETIRTRYKMAGDMLRWVMRMDEQQEKHERFIEILTLKNNFKLQQAEHE